MVGPDATSNGTHHTKLSHFLDWLYLSVRARFSTDCADFCTSDRVVIAVNSGASTVSPCDAYSLQKTAKT